MAACIKNTYVQFVLLLIPVYFIAFHKIDTFHLRWWDESLFAVNTYEMMHNGKYFSFYYDQFPDLWNTKPPLTCWIQAVFVKIFGYNELALRLPSALATGLSVFLVFYYVNKWSSRSMAWISALVLLTSWGFVHFHTGRTGDSDALLTLFLLCANLVFISYLLEPSSKNILLFFVFITLSFAVKLHAAFLFAPAYFILLIWQKKFKSFVFNWYFAAGIIFFIVSAAGLIYLRECDTPGYLETIFIKDAGRIFDSFKMQKETALFYFAQFFTTRFTWWAMLFIVGGLFVLFYKFLAEKVFFKSVFILDCVYLSVITFSSTRLEWYDMPVYPLMAIVAAYPVWILMNTLFPPQSLLVKPFLLCVVFCYPIYAMFNKSQVNCISAGEKKLEANEEFIYRYTRANKSLHKVKVWYNAHKGALLFYKYRLAEKKQHISLVWDSPFKPGDKVLVCHDSLKRQLKHKYIYTTIDSVDSAMLVGIEGLK